MSFITSPGVIFPPLTAGGVAYGTGSQAKVNTAGILGQYLVSGGAGVPTFTDLGTFTTVNCTNLVSSGTLASSFTVTGGTEVPLTITNVGTGNSFVVEDQASTDSTPFVINAAGITVVGHAAAITGVFNSAILQVHNVAGNTAQSILRYSADAFGPDIDFAKSRSATTGTQTVVVSGDLLGSMRFAGSDGTSFIQGALIEAKVDGTPGTNDMPGRLTFSTTADGASTPTERMRIDSAGNVGIGGTASAGRTLQIAKNITGSTFSVGVTASGTVQSDVTVAGIGFATSLSTQATAFTAGLLYHYYASQGTIGAGSTVTDQRGYVAETSLTGATNNYGFLSSIAAAANRFNFYALGTAANFFAGIVGVGVNPSINTAQFIVGGTKATDAFSSGIASTVTFGAGVLTRADSVLSFPSVNNSSGATTGLNHFAAFQGTFTTAVTSQFGFIANNTLTGATNNYGFYSNIAAAANRFNFYAAGTAVNFFAGSVGIGITAAASAILDAQSTTKGVRMPNMTTTQKNAIASPATGLIVFDITLAKLAVYSGTAWETVTSI